MILKEIEWKWQIGWIPSGKSFKKNQKDKLAPDADSKFKGMEIREFGKSLGNSKRGISPNVSAQASATSFGQWKMKGM
jgi:hypothetical protein